MSFPQNQACGNRRGRSCESRTRKGGTVRREADAVKRKGTEEFYVSLLDFPKISYKLADYLKLRCVIYLQIDGFKPRSV